MNMGASCHPLIKSPAESLTKNTEDTKDEEFPSVSEDEA